MQSGFLESFPETSDTFAALPEWIIEDIVEFYLFVLKYIYILNSMTSRVNPLFFENGQKDVLVTFVMVMLHRYDYIKNPYLKSKFVEV